MERDTHDEIQAGIEEVPTVVPPRGYYPGRYGQLVLRDPVELGWEFIDDPEIPPNIILGQE